MGKLFRVPVCNDDDDYGDGSGSDMNKFAHLSSFVEKQNSIFSKLGFWFRFVNMCSNCLTQITPVQMCYSVVYEVYLFIKCTNNKNNNKN